MRAGDTAVAARLMEDWDQWSAVDPVTPSDGVDAGALGTVERSER